MTDGAGVAGTCAASWRTGLGAWVVACAGVVSLASCAVQFENLEPARELAAAARPPGSAAAGWAVYESRCSRCHGPSATQPTQGPDLVQRVASMGATAFAGRVLDRYGPELARPADDAAPDVAQAAPGAVAPRGGMPSGQERRSSMQAWRSDPQVATHIADLYAYLSARSAGLVGPGRPPP